GQPSEVAQQPLVVSAAECGVVDDALRAGKERSESLEAAHRGGGFTARFRYPVDVEDDAAVRVFGTRGDEHEFGAPGDLAVTFEMQAGIAFSAPHEDFAGGLVDAGVARLRAVERRNDLAVGVDHAAQVRMRP